MSDPNQSTVKPDGSTASKLGPQVVDNTTRRMGLLQAIGQLDMLIGFFGDAPERVRVSAKEFRDALEEWSNA